MRFWVPQRKRAIRAMGGGVDGFLPDSGRNPSPADGLSVDGGVYLEVSAA
jgi:hypothetical protein